jgi:hypothetical protein
LEFSGLLLIPSRRWQLYLFPLLIVLFICFGSSGSRVQGLSTSDHPPISISNSFENIQIKSNSRNLEGTINTLITPEKIITNSEKIDHNTMTIEYLLGGKWRLDVLNGRVTYFKSNLTMINIHGSDIHFHIITFIPTLEKASNFVTNSKEYGVFKGSNNTSYFSGVADVITNGVLEWEDVPILVSIINEKIIKIAFKNGETASHFLGKPIFGLVTSIEDIASNSTKI